MSLGLVFGCLAVMGVGILLFCFAPLMCRKQNYALSTRRKILGLSVAVLLGSLGLYAVVGSPLLPSMEQQRQAKLAELRATLKDKSDFLKEHPDSVPTMLEYADILQQAGKLREAMMVLKNAVIASQGQPQIILLYVQSQVMANKGILDAEALRGIELLETLMPEHPHLRFYTGLRAAQDNNPAEALRIWNALEKELPPEHGLHEAIASQRKALQK